MAKEYNIIEKVKETISKYNLVKKGEKVAVALSGGKDSTTTLYLLHKLGYDVQGLMIDLDLGEWSKTHKKNMEKFCQELGIKLTVVDLKKEIGHGICFIKAVLKKEKNLSGCTVCGVIRKWILNKWAKKIKVDKIATGHNIDDEAHTVLMNFLKGNVYLGINSTPATGESNDIFVQRIKPLFFIPEDEIRKFSRKMNFPVLYEKCPCAFGTYRIETREWSKFLSDKEKLKIVEEFQKLVHELRKKHATAVVVCKNCREASRNGLCNACRILGNLKK